MSYYNAAVVIHGPHAVSDDPGAATCPHYEQPPTITAAISAGDVSRSGNTISCDIIGSLNAMGGSHFFGYSIAVYAQLDDGPKVQIISKPSSPSTWANGTYGLGGKTLTSTNTSTACLLKIYTQSNCTNCTGSGELHKVYEKRMSAPSSIKYKLTLKAGAGVSEFSGSGSYEPGTAASTTATAKAGYKLKNYTGTKADGTSGGTWETCKGKSTHTTTWQMDCDRTITAHASGISYTISYHANGGEGTMNSQSVTFGDSVTPKTNKFTRDHFKFKGWNTKADGSGTDRNSEWTYKTVGDTKLYAQWKREGYTVTYDANGGSQPPASQTKESGKDLKLTSDIPKVAKKITITLDPNGGSVDPTSITKSLSFSSWNTKEDGTGTKYTSGGTYTKDSNVTLYAKWSSVSVGNLPTPYRDNCIFDGWFESLDGTEGIVLSTTTYKKSRTIYARWQYEVEYDLNGGYLGDNDSDTGNQIPVDIKIHNQDLTLTNIKPKKTGKEFKGWATSPSATEPTYKAKGTYSKNEPITLYAVYGDKTFTVTFDLRGGTYKGGGALTQTIKYGGDATPPNDPTKAEYKFMGWVGNYKNIKKDKVIYALWCGCPIWILEEDSSAVNKKEWHSYLDKQ